MTSITAATPVAIIGAGPVGLAAAAHLAERDLPFLAPLSELRLDLDPAVEAPVALTPLLAKPARSAIDPNLHSCGTVRPHGVDELSHPEPGFFIIGMKSYGRAPTFLLLTGYEQARSVTAALAGDWEAARHVELELPETGCFPMERRWPLVRRRRPASTSAVSAHAWPCGSRASGC